MEALEIAQHDSFTNLPRCVFVALGDTAAWQRPRGGVLARFLRSSTTIVCNPHTRMAANGGQPVRGTTRW